MPALVALEAQPALSPVLPPVTQAEAVAPQPQPDLLLIVTRPAAQAAPWVAALQALGQPAAALPLIRIAPPADADAAAARQAWQQLASHDLVMFVSANAVQQFFALAPAGAAWPDGTLAGSTGPGTSAALRAAGVPRTRLVEPPPAEGRFDSEALWAQLLLRPALPRHVLVVRGEGGRDWLADTLHSHGATVAFVAAYRRQPPLLDDAQQALLQAALLAPARHLWLFSSSEAVLHLQALAPQADWSHSRAAASHARIAATARAAAFGSVLETASSPAGVLQALAQSAPL